MNEIHRIAVILNDRSFEYDIYTLVIAFFQGVKTQVFDPDQEIPEDTDLVIKARIGDDRVGLQAGGTAREIAVPEPGERKVMKNIIKRNLYEMLRDLCGRDLPWGNLTGIRPVKLAMQFLLEAAGDSEKGGTAGQPENKDSTDTMVQSGSKDKAGTMDQSESKDKAGTVVWSWSKDKNGPMF